MEPCPCGLDASYDDCCGPLIRGERKAETAEQLMRSRYTAYTKAEMEYIRDTTHPDKRQDFDMKGSKKWAEESEWRGLEIIETQAGGPEDDEGKVEFIATFVQKNQTQRHHELSTFKKVDGTWYFEDGEGVKAKQFVRDTPKIRRNDPCPCGSGRKYKKCCYGK